MTATAYELIVDKLREQGKKVRANGTKANAQCPAHEDRNPSLSITRIEGSVLVYCHTGCPTEAVLAALSLTKRDLFDDHNGVDYRYDDGRIVHRTPDKQFPQYGNKNGRPTLYRLSKVIEAVKNLQPIYLCEGEKDVHALETLGVVATTAPMGADNFDKVDITPLINADIIAVAHQDEAGDTWAQHVWDKLNGYAPLRFKKAAVGNDAADHVAAGKPLHALLDDPRHFEPAERRLKVTRASDITMTATRWLWEDGPNGWIPQGHLVGFGGREGVGKSTWCADIAAKVTKGELPGDSYGIPKGVIIVSTEDDWEATIKPRLVAAGADLDRAFHVAAIEPDGLEGTLSLPEDIQRLAEIIREHDVALVILDPLLTLINKKLDTHKDAEVRQALGPMTKLAHETKVSLIGLVHVNKSTEGDLLNRIMASRALTGVPRAFLFCAKYTPMEQEHEAPGPEDALGDLRQLEFVFGQIKNNLAAKVAISLRYHMDTEVVGYDNANGKDIKASKLHIDTQPVNQNVEDIVLDQEKAKKKVKSQRAKAEVWLVTFLAGKGEVPSRFVVRSGKEAGYSRDAIHGARREMEDRIEVINLPVVPRQTAWKLIPG